MTNSPKPAQKRHSVKLHRCGMSYAVEPSASPNVDVRLVREDVPLVTAHRLGRLQGWSLLSPRRRTAATSLGEMRSPAAICWPVALAA